MTSLNNIKIIDKCVFGDWEYLIYENDGVYSESDQMLSFELNGVEVTVYFRLTIRGWWTYTPETYYQPAEGETHITDVEFDIENVFINDEEVKVSKELNSCLEALLKNNVVNE